MQHFDRLLYDHTGGFWRKGTAADFISSFDVQMLGRKITRGSVAVRNHERILEWRSLFIDMPISSGPRRGV